MGKEIGLSKSQVGAYESGKSDPAASIIEKYVNYFGVSYNDLMGRDIEKEGLSTNQGETSDQPENVNQAIERLKGELAKVEQLILQQNKDQTSELERIKRELIARDPALAKELGIE